MNCWYCNKPATHYLAWEDMEAYDLCDDCKKWVESQGLACKIFENQNERELYLIERTL